jgi:LacI family transcriptional regulator
MADVAAAAGVSVKTVSRVVNDEPGVRAGTAGRVRQAIAGLGFQRNHAASFLRRRSIQHVSDSADPHTSAVARAIEAAARVHGFVLSSISAQRTAGREEELLAVLLLREDTGAPAIPDVSPPGG